MGLPRVRHDWATNTTINTTILVSIKTPPIGTPSIALLRKHCFDEIKPTRAHTHTHSKFLQNSPSCLKIEYNNNNIKGLQIIVCSQNYRSVTPIWEVFFFFPPFHPSLCLSLAWLSFYSYSSSTVDKDIRKKPPVPKTLWWPFHCVIILALDNTKGVIYWWWQKDLLFQR